MGTPFTKTASVASSFPTTNARRYVDIRIVGANLTASFPTPAGRVPATAVLEIAASASSTMSVTSKTALKPGSSQQGNARLASVASNCVTASVAATPSGPLTVLR
jgi:hypothetical protein